MKTLVSFFPSLELSSSRPRLFVNNQSNEYKDTEKAQGLCPLEEKYVLSPKGSGTQVRVNIS